MDVGLIVREKGVGSNLRNCHMLRDQMILFEAMDNPRSTKEYETLTALIQVVLFQAILCQQEGIYKLGRSEE